MEVQRGTWAIDSVESRRVLRKESDLARKVDGGFKGPRELLKWTDPIAC